MSTHSAIGRLLSDGRVQAIYCQFDGYLTHNGRILLEHYTTLDVVVALLELGDISSLDETLEKTEAYHRDRDEFWPDVEPKTFESVQAWLADSQEYNYLFDPDRGWLVAYDTDTPVSLADALASV